MVLIYASRIYRDKLAFSLGASTANGYPFTKNQFVLPAQISLPASKAASTQAAENNLWLLAIFCKQQAKRVWLHSHKIDFDFWDFPNPFNCDMMI